MAHLFCRGRSIESLIWVEDEYDIDEDVMIASREDGDFLVNALIQLEDFNEHFVAHPADEHADTLAGWLRISGMCRGWAK